MVRATKKQKQNSTTVQAERNPEAEERTRLKKLAFASNIISDKPPLKSSFTQLLPSKTVVKHHGKDIIKKSQRKNRFLFSFPGLLAPVSGGKIGELKDLGTKNPILYLDFPQGRMKLFGTIVFPKNRYLTLQFSKGGKNVMCDDYFDTMLTFGYRLNTTETTRLKKLAFASNIISDKPPLKSSFTQLLPSKTVVKHHGKDIIKKSQRKNRFLFSFPGLLAPVSGGKIGELKDLGTKNPILYLDFPQGRMKLFGTIVFPKNRYLTLQFSKGGKNVMCDDYFDTMIVFSDAWWIGKKEENPDEVRLEFPKELNEGQPVGHDFKGGAGGTSETKKESIKSGVTHVREQSPEAESEDDFSSGDINLTPPLKTTPVRHSERTAKKIFKFAGDLSGDSSVDGDQNISEGEKEVGMEPGSSTRNKSFGKTEITFFNFGKDDAVTTDQIRLGLDSTTLQGTSKKTTQSATQVTKHKEVSRSTQGPLVQSTISTLFKKVEEKRESRDSTKPQSPSRKLELNASKRKIDQADVPRKKAKVTEERKGSGMASKNKLLEDSDSVEPVKVSGRKKRTGSATGAPILLEDSASPELPISPSQAEDDIEDFSSSSQDTSGSDEDWAA